jgi:hypothetical protein
VRHRAGREDKPASPHTTPCEGRARRRGDVKQPPLREGESGAALCLGCVDTPRTTVSPDAAVGAFSELTRAGTPGWKHLRRQQQRRNEQNRQQHRGVCGLKEHSQARPHQRCILPHVCAQPPREVSGGHPAECAAGELRRYEYRQWYGQGGYCDIVDAPARVPRHQTARRGLRQG